jgi:hypothetical protein
MSLLATLSAGAFAVGLLGGVHCLGMCGGIAASLAGEGGRHPAWAVRLAYNAGRVGSYGLAGAVAGGVGGAGLLLGSLLPVQVVFYVVANLLLVGLGLYLAGWTGFVSRIEGPGRRLWAHLQPLAGRLLPARSIGQGLALGAVWGWIPCGLVYSVLGTALLTGSPAGGATVMLAFGAGTLPNLLAAGWLLGRGRRWARSPGIRLAAGGLVAGFGLVGLARAASLGDALRGGLACLS